MYYRNLIFSCCTLTIMSFGQRCRDYQIDKALHAMGSEAFQIEVVSAAVPAHWRDVPNGFFGLGPSRSRKHQRCGSATEPL
ncbi:hypothetical protein ACMV_13340 [Acidiphilium multivorum AIU301]|uniref:Uncharacterized protein n=2 Tax=Acidiphilium TaxID=522 RepID=A5FY18_ACICJ|nr:hypothetical protein Acry_1289 [Acidiphilium cryptum JF-5]BAJ80681.1 hypothetical protein ACMV_13340 [Acidiphilium multivorum AIU301]